MLPGQNRATLKLPQCWFKFRSGLGSSAGNNTPYNPHKHRTQNCAHSSCVEKERLHTYTKQCIESYMNIYMCIFLL